MLTLSQLFGDHRFHFNFKNCQVDQLRKSFFFFFFCEYLLYNIKYYSLQTDRLKRAENKVLMKEEKAPFTFTLKELRVVQ